MPVPLKNANNTKMPKPEKPRWHLRCLKMPRLGTKDAKTTTNDNYVKKIPACWSPIEVWSETGVLRVL